jgi:hypothetical protein
VARRILRFTKPWDQFMIVLPTISSLVFIALVSFSLMGHVRALAVQVLTESNATAAVIQRFQTEVNLFVFVYWVSAGVLGIIGMIWMALVTYRVFGPLGRLERELVAIRDGVMDPVGLRVRHVDAIYKIVELFRQILIQRSK